jgi:hypothetical protein
VQPFEPQDGLKGFFYGAPLTISKQSWQMVTDLQASRRRQSRGVKKTPFPAVDALPELALQRKRLRYQRSARIQSGLEGLG